MSLWAVGARPGQEKVVGALPLFHVFGMTGVMNVGIACGFEIILCRASASTSCSR